MKDWCTWMRNYLFKHWVDLILFSLGWNVLRCRSGEKCDGTGIFGQSEVLNAGVICSFIWQSTQSSFLATSVNKLYNYSQSLSYRKYNRIQQMVVLFDFLLNHKRQGHLDHFKPSCINAFQSKSYLTALIHFWTGCEVWVWCVCLKVGKGRKE